MKKVGAFSLVEMLVVVTIVAILAAAMLTTYQIYTTKSKVSKTISILQDLTQQVMISYNSKGTMPTSLQGVSGGGGGGYGAYIIPDTTTFLHYDNGSTWTNKGGLIQLNLDENIGKAILGFTPTTNGSDGDYNAISMAFYDNNGTLTVYCGQWDSTSSLYVPLDYLPAGCNSSGFNTTVTGN